MKLKNRKVVRRHNSSSSSQAANVIYGNRQSQNPYENRGEYMRMRNRKLSNTVSVEEFDNNSGMV